MGKKTLEAFMALVLLPTSPHSRKNLFAFCLERGISVRCIDADLYQNGNQLVLNASDPLTKRYIERIRQLPHSDDPGDVFNHIRNEIMVDLAFKHIEHAHPKVYILVCGASHVLGTAENAFPFEHSISSLLKSAGAHVMPVILSSPEVRLLNLPEDLRETLARDGILIEDLAKDSYKSFPIDQMEKSTIARLVANSGNDIKAYDTDGLVQKYRKNIIAKMQEWVAEAKANPPGLSYTP
jgi:hypothetical protein